MSEARSWIDRIGRRLARWRSRGHGRYVGGRSLGRRGQRRAAAGPASARAERRACGCRWRTWTTASGARRRGRMRRSWPSWPTSLGLPFDLGHWQPHRAGHFESDARRARYDWLVEVARSRGAGVVAVGHTRDDQAETILHRILRGTGPRGLAGIPRRRRLAADPAIQLVRPLLDVSRERDPGVPRRAGPALPRGRVQHRPHADPRPHPPRPPAQTGRRVQPEGRRGPGPARRARRDPPGARSRPTCERWTTTAVISLSPDRMVLKHGVPALAPRLPPGRSAPRRLASAGWPEAGMSARRWRRLAALAREQRDPAASRSAPASSASTEGPFLVLHRAPVAPSEPTRRRIPPGRSCWTSPARRPFPGPAAGSSRRSIPASPGDEVDRPRPAVASPYRSAPRRRGIGSRRWGWAAGARPWPTSSAAGASRAIGEPARRSSATGSASSGSSAIGSPIGSRGRTTPGVA